MKKTSLNVNAIILSLIIVVLFSAVAVVTYQAIHRGQAEEPSAMPNYAIVDIPLTPVTTVDSTTETELIEDTESAESEYVRTIVVIEHEIDDEVLLAAVVESVVDTSVVETEEPEEDTMIYRYRDVTLKFSEADIKMLAALVTLEVGTETRECQQAVASVVINRMIIDNKTLEEVIYQKNLFSVASKVATREPREWCVEAVRDVLENGTTIPIYITYFRAGHFHEWGDRYVNWRQIDRTYFSYDSKLKEKWG